MTVASTTNRKTYTGDNATTLFNTVVTFFTSANLMIFVVNTTTGAATTLTENTHYSVTGGSGSTGTVNLAGGSAPWGALATGTTLVILRELSIVQSADFVQDDGSDAEVTEAAFDKLTMMAQQLDARIDRSFVLADSDVSGASTVIPTPVASTVVGWNSAGTALQNYSAQSLALALTTPFTLTLLDDTSADNFAQTLVAALSAETAPATDDVLLIGDTSEGKGNKMTFASALTVVNGLAEDTAPDEALDFLLTYDASATAAKKITLTSALKRVNALTEDTTPDTAADFVLTYDTSASTVKKAKPQNLGANTNGTAAASTSGTSIDFTSIPAGTKRIVVTLSGVSTNGTSQLQVQIGKSGGVETSGYLSNAGGVNNAGALGSVAAAVATGFQFTTASAAADVWHGQMILTLMDATTFTWAASGSFMSSGGSSVMFCAGSKSLAAELDRVRLTTINGTDAFDAGKVNIQYSR